MAGIWKCRCASARAGLRVLELPVAYRRRSGGESKVAGNLRGSLKAGSRIIATFARVAMEPAPEPACPAPAVLDRDLAEKSVDAAAQTFGSFLDGLRRRQHRIRR